MQSSFLMRSLCIFPSTNWNEKNRVKLNSREGECSIPLLINSFFGSMIRDETCPVLVHYLLHNTNSLRAKTSNSWTIYHSNKSLQFNLSQLICNGVNEQLNVYEECSIDSWTILKNRKRIAMWRNRSSFRFKSFYHCTIDSSRFTYSSPTKINKLKIRETGHERERWPRNIETGTAHALFYWRLSIRRVARYEHRNKTQRSNFHETPLPPPLPYDSIDARFLAITIALLTPYSPPRELDFGCPYAFFSCHVNPPFLHCSPFKSGNGNF